MAKFINFIPRQMMMTGTFYSDPFDVSDAHEVFAEIRVYASSSASAITGALQESDDFTTWSAYGSTVTATGGQTTTGSWTTVPKRFLRAKIDVPAGPVYAMLHFSARAFC
jgi:hypothetical protein